MWLDLLLLALGIGLLLAGGRNFVGGASALAKSLGVSDLAIGMTVVAFGTSAPELVVNVLAAASGRTEIAFGNIVGSNVANVGLVLALAALIRPLLVESQIISREIPMMLLATAGMCVLGLDRLRGSAEFYDLPDGMILLLLFSVFLYYSIAEVVGQRRSDPLAEAVRGTPSRLRSVGVTALQTLLGLLLLLGGADLTVDHAVSLAERLEVPRAVIGLTLVAIGTSLPELVTSLLAASRGQTDLAIGGVVGSNIFNLLFILGVTSLIAPVPLPERGLLDLAALGVLSMLLVPFALRGRGIERGEGALLLSGYVAYLLFRLGI